MEHKFTTTQFVSHISKNEQGGILKKYDGFLNRQQVYRAGWWFVSLLLHGCALVPLTFLAVYSMDGPVLPFLFISMACFFINFISFMGGAPFKVCFNTLILSITANLLMLAVTVTGFLTR